MAEMILIGSRVLGIHNEGADWDYATLDLEEGGTFHQIQNNHFERRKHCYHYNRDYRYRVARFEIDDIDDWQFVYNPVDYLAGLIDVNPLQYRDKWVEKLKQINFFHFYWYDNRRRKPMKRAYHLVYNIEVLRENSVNLSEKALQRVKQWHDGKVTYEDYDALIEEIMTL